MNYIFEQSPCKVKLDNKVLAGYFIFESEKKGATCTGFVGKTEEGTITRVSFVKTAVSDDALNAKVAALDFSTVSKLKKKD